jgi:hypothetical protein
LTVPVFFVLERLEYGDGMTQQVIHCRVMLKSRDAEVDDPSWGFTFEATGSDTDFTFDDTSPVAALLYLLDGSTTFTQNNGVDIVVTNPWGLSISPVISRVAGDAQVSTFDVTGHLDGSAAGAAIRIDTTTLATSAGEASLPEGVAAGVSWRGDYGSTPEYSPGSRPRSRLRNRCYVGPLTNSTAQVIATDGTGASRVLTDGLGADLANGIDLLMTNNTAADTSKQWDLVTWSRADAAVSDAKYYAISERFDYQRRRTERATNEDWIHGTNS